MIFVFGQQIEGFPREVISGVVQRQDQPPVSVGFQELFKELVELGGVLLGMEQVVDLAGSVVQRPVHAELLVRAGGRYGGTDAPEGPHLRQGRVEMNLTLIEEEEVEVVPRVERVFFRKSKIAFFSL